MTTIVITGTPCTGKTTLAKFVEKKLDYKRLDLHDYYEKLAVAYNKEKKCYDLDLKKLESLVKKQKGNLVIDSHIAHLLPKKMVDLCIVLTCSNLKELEKRLQKRKYSSKKIRENLDAEIFQICLNESKELEHKLLVFDQDVEKEEIIKEINPKLQNLN
jgi:adenylate kinase